MFQTGGNPSTWFPPVGLVELYVLENILMNTFLFEKIENSENFEKSCKYDPRPKLWRQMENEFTLSAGARAQSE